jgi:hypothetical protein
MSLLHKPAKFVWNARVGKMVKAKTGGSPFVVQGHAPIPSSFPNKGTLR